VLQVLVLQTQRLGGCEVARVVVDLLLVGVVLLELFGRHVLCGSRVVPGVGVGHLAMVREQLLEVLGAEDRDLGKQQLTLHQWRGGVIQHSPDGHEVLELAAGLLDNAILPLQDNGHAREVGDLGGADDQRVDVEAARGQDPGHARQHARLVLHEAVQDVAVARRLRGQRGFVQDARDGGGGRHAGARCGGGQRLDAAVQRLVGDGGGRG
jgi:hypothetical protein